MKLTVLRLSKIRKDSFYTKISNFYELKPNLFLLDFLGLIQYTSENLTFKGSPERLTRCQSKEATMETSKQVLICYFCVKTILTETLQ